MEKKKRIILIIVISVILLALVVFSVFLVTTYFTKKNVNNVSEDIYNKELYVSARLPDIDGNENVSLDEFGKKSNKSEEVLKDKKWMNLDFTDFEVYSMNSKTSVISFKIINNNYMVIETGKFQLQLKDNTGNIVSLIDFDEISLPSSAQINVKVDVVGDITNVKDIVIDEITYKMNLTEVE